MISDKTLKQESGDSSQNYQASTINQYGLTYADAKEVAIDVFKANFVQLSESAAKVARERAEELVDSFLNEIKDRGDLVSSIEEPSMQNALYSAQKSYAINGDKEVLEMLVNTLVERAERKDRTLSRIVLDESLEVIHKLTSEQLDILSLVFIIRYSINHNVSSLDKLQTYLRTYLEPFAGNLTTELSAYQHLEYCNCGTVSVLGVDLGDQFLNVYKGLFCKGVDSGEFLLNCGNLTDFRGLVVGCLHDPQKLQLNALNEEVFDNKALEAGISPESKDKLHNYFASSYMNRQEVEDYLKAGNNFMSRIFEVWSTSSMNLLTLTTVGIALAQANFKRRVKDISFDLSIWVK